MKSHLTMSCSQESSSSPKHSKKRGVARRCCQVQGCNEDLTFSKEYHRKHKVCEKHSKSPKVVVGGLDQRFCQQCSRFHLLEEFDEGKRSCRKRLAGHNERRRKPPPLLSKSCSTLLLTSAFGHYQHNDVLLDGPSMFHSGRTSNPGWDNLKRLNTDYQGWSSKMKAENQMGRYNCGYAANTELGNNGSNLLLHGSRMSTDLCNTDQCTPHSGVPMRHFLTSPISTKGDVNSSGVQDLSGIMDPGSALSLLSPHSWSSSEASGGPLEMNSSGSRALEHPMHQDQSSNSHPLSHDFTSNYGYVEDRMLPPSAYMLKNAEPTRYYEIGLNSTDDKNLSGLRVPNINGVKVPMQDVFHGSLRNGEQACRVPMASSFQGYGGTMDSLSMHRKDGHP